MKSPEFAEKMKKGPVALLSVWPKGPVSMGMNLVMWFLYTAVMGLFAAYITGRALPIGSTYLHVFRFAGATTFLGYSARSGKCLSGITGRGAQLSRQRWMD